MFKSTWDNKLTNLPTQLWLKHRIQNDDRIRFKHYLTTDELFSRPNPCVSWEPMCSNRCNPAETCEKTPLTSFEFHCIYDQTPDDYFHCQFKPREYPTMSRQPTQFYQYRHRDLPNICPIKPRIRALLNTGTANPVYMTERYIPEPEQSYVHPKLTDQDYAVRFHKAQYQVPPPRDYDDRFNRSYMRRTDFGLGLTPFH